ncbi:RIF1 protein, partial [Turnix velox]|nr:RIF1 protein [Turnix velox]
PLSLGPHLSANAATPRMNLSFSSPAGVVVIPSIQLLGIEMLLHFLMGPEVVDFAKQNKLVLSLEPLQSPLISSSSFFCKHGSTFINAVQDGFIAVGKEVPDCMLSAIWKDINGYVKTAIESGNKKEKQGSEILTMLLQALKNIVRSNYLPVQKILTLIDITVKELPSKVLGSPAYQVADMDLLNGTPALFLIQLPFRNNLLECCVTDERFFGILTTLVGFVLSGPTSPLAFSESVIGILNQSAKQVENKEHLWRMWSIVVNPLTEWINRTNEVNQGDALEHNFSAVYSALLLPVSHIFPLQEFPQPTMKSLLRTWSELYRAFARCAALVATAEENLCCEELCAKIISGLEGETPVNFSMMDGLTHIVSVMVDCINFAPYGTKYQPKTRSPQTPTERAKKKKEPLGKLASLFKLLVMLLNSFHTFSSKENCSETLTSVGQSLLAVLHNIISHISLPSVIGTMFAVFSKPLAMFYEKNKLADAPKMHSDLNNKLDKLLAEIIQCVQSHCTGSYDSELLAQLSPLLCVIFQHKSKQLCNQCAHFWNSTFAKTTSLTYPEELKSVLSQVKKKIPLLLPGFESVEMAEECSSPFPDAMENSQLDAKISGMEVKLGQKRDSILAQMSEPKNEIKDKASNAQVTSAKLKLEFSSLKTKSEILLEEEKSVDFVFIPPETKARILTEHQKEVLRSKRVDIPVMYNNLDASQDTILFSQDTQSQEDSFKPTHPLLFMFLGQEENAKKEDCTSTADDMAEDPVEEKSPNTHIKESSASKGEGESQRDTAETVLEETSVGDGLESSAMETSSKEPSAGSENSSHLSSSSTSCDIISGTPQPVSRRQSFITLEKFGSSENRPFSPSALSSFSKVSGSGSAVRKQENKSMCKTGTKAEKPGDDDKKPPKCQSEQLISALHRMTRRQSKMEHQGNKKPKDSSAPSSVENSPAFSATGDVESVLLAHSQSLHSAEEEIKKAEDMVEEAEMVRALDTDSKENTPPETTVLPDQGAEDDSQLPLVSPHQKACRRSSRRRSETAEGPAGSQDKEDGHQKRERHKDSEKPVAKKVPQPKDDASQKQKAVPGKTPENTSKRESSPPERSAAEDLSSKEAPASGGLEEEATKRRKLEDNVKTEAEGQDSSLSTAGQKKVGCPRYHTRSSQGKTLSSIENSESDGSQPKEGSTKKKKWMKVRNKLGSVEGKSKDGQAGGDSHEVSSQGNEIKVLETCEAEPSPEAGTDAALTSGVCDVKHEERLPDAVEVVTSASTKDSTTTEKASGEPVSNPPVESTASPCVSDPDLKAPELKKPLEKPPKAEGCGAAVLPQQVSAANAVGGDLSLQGPECQNKRRRRAKRARNWDCCSTNPKQPLLSVSESKTESTQDQNGPRSTPVQTPVKAPVVSGNSSLDESLSMAPCAMSTPLHPPKEPAAFEVTEERTSEDVLQGDSVVAGEGVENAEGAAGDISDSVVETREPADESDPVGQRLSETGAEGPAEGDSSVVAGSHGVEPAAPVEEEISQNGHLEEKAEELVENKPEKNQMDEVEGSGGGEGAAENTEGSCTTQDTEMKEELVEAEIAMPENAALDKEDAVESNGVASPRKPEDESSLVVPNESPSGMQARCTWSPSASPSTSILKRGVKRHQEDDCLSPANKIRRVSFANPIYQEELADDIDRRSPVVRPHSSPSSRSLKILSNLQVKHITTPTKGFLSPGSRNHKFKSSKKCLITEMAKEQLPCPTECVFPPLANCKVPIDVILPQITSNICARGLGQLIRARNIKTVGDLSALTAAEIETLPIRSPKVSSVRKALKGYHEQQVKLRGSEEMSALEDAEKPLSNSEEKSLPAEEEKVAAGTSRVVPTFTSSATEPPGDLPAQIQALAAQLTAQDLHSYSGSQLFEMQEQLVAMTNCILKNLRSRWRSPPHDSSD